jgi:hypothetical protein
MSTSEAYQIISFAQKATTHLIKALKNFVDGDNDEGFKRVVQALNAINEATIKAAKVAPSYKTAARNLRKLRVQDDSDLTVFPEEFFSEQGGTMDEADSDGEAGKAEVEG